MILPNDPNDLKTNYQFSKSDITWTKNMFNAVKYFILWQTSEACYLLVEKEKVVALLSYNTDFKDPNYVIEQISRVKASVDIIGWNFGYDKTLGETMLLESDDQRHQWITEKFNEHFKKLGAKEEHLIDVDNAVKDACDFFTRVDGGETITDPKYF